MKETILILGKKLIPYRLKHAVVSFIATTVHRVYIEEWTETMLIPLEQKLLRFEAHIEKIEADHASSTSSPRPIEQRLLKLEKELEQLKKIQLSSHVGEN